MSRSKSQVERWALFVYFVNNPEPAIVNTPDELQCRALATHYATTWGSIPRPSRLGAWFLIEVDDQVVIGEAGIGTMKAGKLKAVFNVADIVGVMVASSKHYIVTGDDGSDEPDDD